PERGGILVEHTRGPVVHLLAAPVAGRVPQHRQGRAERDLEAGLLGYLAHRGARDALARVELALGPGPVVVARAVDEQDLEAALALAPHERSRGENGRATATRHRWLTSRRRGRAMSSSSTSSSGRTAG